MLFLLGGKMGSAAERYCTNLVELLKDRAADVANFSCRLNRVGLHGTRKAPPFMYQVERLIHRQHYPRSPNAVNGLNELPLLISSWGVAWLACAGHHFC
jgi:hypothetical protein